MCVRTVSPCELRLAEESPATTRTDDDISPVMAVDAWESVRAAWAPAGHENANGARTRTAIFPAVSQPVSHRMFSSHVESICSAAAEHLREGGSHDPDLNIKLLSSEFIIQKRILKTANVQGRVPWVLILRCILLRSRAGVHIVVYTGARQTVLISNKHASDPRWRQTLLRHLACGRVPINN